MSRPLDPLALAVHGGVAVIAIAIAVWLLLRGGPEPASEAAPVAKADSAPPPPPKAAAKAQSNPRATLPEKPPAGRTWHYRVTLQPDTWKDATLSYRTVEQVQGLAVYTEFRHAAGKMNFNLGQFAPAHPSHANVRFPGFFMHAAYLDRPLEVGQKVAWQWPWQLPGGAVRDGRIKRYVGEVKAWENVQAPVGTHDAARIETTLQYIEDGKVVASRKETLWYAPRVWQLIRVVREGRTPDEGFERIVAELAELR